MTVQDKKAAVSCPRSASSLQVEVSVAARTTEVIMEIINTILTLYLQVARFGIWIAA